MTSESIKKIISKYPPKREYLIQMLHEIQDNSGQNYIPEAALEEIVKYCKLSKAAVMGVVEYYSMFSIKPRGRFLVRICFSPVCTNHEAEAVLAEIIKHFKLNGINTPCKNGLLSIEKSECLGRCGQGTAVSINKHYFEDVKASDICSKIEDYIKQNSL